MALARSARSFDLLLFGTTGYTGRLIAGRLVRGCATRRSVSDYGSVVKLVGSK